MTSEKEKNLEDRQPGPENQMISRDLESFTALGRSLTSARDKGVISPEQFASTARALALAMLTGMIEMDAYAGIHWVLGIMIEAAFTSPAKKKRDELGTHIETVGQMWNYVGPSGEALKAVDRFLDRSLSMEKARFERPARLVAPMSVSFNDFGRMIRAAGVIVHESGGPKLNNPATVMLTAEVNLENTTHLVVGWGERRMAFIFS